MSMWITALPSDTATSPVTPTRAFPPAPINFGADWRIIRDTGTEILLTNLLSPMDQPEQIRVAYSEISDIFKGTGLTAKSTSAVTQNTKGASILIQLTGMGNDAAGLLYPYSAHLVLKVPFGTDPAASDITMIIKRLLGSLYATGSDSCVSRVEGLIRGSLKPIEL